MGLQIQGRDGTPIEVSREGSLRVSGWDAFMENALTKGDAYIFASIDADVNVDDTLLIVRNDSHNMKLIIIRVELTNGDVASIYPIHKVTTAYTASNNTGNEINAGGWGKEAPATVSNDETANAIGTIIGYLGGSVAVGNYHRDTCVVLNQGEALGVDQPTESTGGAVTMYGFFVPNSVIEG